MGGINTISNGSVMVFVGAAGVEPPLKVGAQLKFCDVFYTQELIVGFDVTGAPDDVIAGFFVEKTPDTILFFVVGEDPVPTTDLFQGEADGTINFFNVSEEEDPPGVDFFGVTDEPDDTILFFNVADVTEEDFLFFFANEDP